MQTKNVVIVGGGFAGIRLAQKLEKRLPEEWGIQLLSRENYITFNPLLAEVVGASLLPGHVVAPLRQMLKRTRVWMVTVTGINLEDKLIEYVGEGSGVVPFDHLVLACGQSANLAVVKGMASYALPLKTLGDALFLRNRIIVRLEQAELQPRLDERRWLTTFIVVGGGFSGVEVAGELVDFLRASRKYYPRIQKDDCRVVLLHGGDRLLPELAPSLGEFALRKLCMEGLDIRLNARAALVDDRAVQLDTGERITGGTVICTVGTSPHELIAGLTVAMQRGRIVTAPDMSVPEHPGVWAVGDCALVPNAFDNSVCPPTAQFADRQGQQLADNIIASVASRATRGFSYRPMGQLASIGHTKAVAQIFKLKLAGFTAWLLWRGVYLLKIPTVSRKVRLYLEWTWAMFFPPDIAHLGFRRTRRAPPAPRDVGADRSRAA